MGLLASLCDTQRYLYGHSLARSRYGYEDLNAAPGQHIANKRRRMSIHMIPANRLTRILSRPEYRRQTSADRFRWSATPLRKSPVTNAAAQVALSHRRSGYVSDELAGLEISGFDLTHVKTRPATFRTKARLTGPGTWERTGARAGNRAINHSDSIPALSRKRVPAAAMISLRVR